MKKAILSIVVLICAGTLANAQKLSADKLPLAVKSAFSKNHPDVKKVTWEKETAGYEAGFVTGGVEMAEVYNGNGQRIETEQEIKAAELPLAVTSYIKTHFKNAKIAEAAKITKADGTVVFEAEIKGKDYLFDSKGNLIK